MFTSIGRFTVRRRRLVLLSTVAFVLAAGALGGGVFDRLSTGGFEDPDSESAQASAYLEETFGAGAPNIVLLVTAEGGDVDDPEVTEVGLELTEELAAVEGADDVVSYWSLGGPPPLATTEGDAALVVGRLLGDPDAQAEVAEVVRDELAGDPGAGDRRRGRHRRDLPRDRRDHRG